MGRCFLFDDNKVFLLRGQGDNCAGSSCYSIFHMGKHRTEAGFPHGFGCSIIYTKNFVHIHIGFDGLVPAIRTFYSVFYLWRLVKIKTATTACLRTLRSAIICVNVNKRRINVFAFTIYLNSSGRYGKTGANRNNFSIFNDHRGIGQGGAGIFYDRGIGKSIIAVSRIGRAILGKCGLRKNGYAEQRTTYRGKPKLEFSHYC